MTTRRRLHRVIPTWLTGSTGPPIHPSLLAAMEVGSHHDDI